VAKLTAKQLEKHLNARSHDDLVIDIPEMFKRLETVKSSERANRRLNGLARSSWLAYGAWSILSSSQCEAQE